MIDDVTSRLTAFGYAATELDIAILPFIITKVENKIKSECNVDEIPEALNNIAIDMICGEFLFSMKQSGKLTDSFDLDTMVTSVATGDTSVSFDPKYSVEQRLNTLIDYLMNKGEGEFACYRTLKW